MTISNLTSGGDLDGGSSSSTASIAPTANRLILLTVSSRTGITANPNQPTVTGNGLTWVAINSIVYDTTSSSRRRVTLFRAMGAAPSAGAVAIDFGGQAQTDVGWSVDQSSSGVDISGTNGSGAIVQSATNKDEAGGTSLTVTLAAFGNSGNATFGAFAIGDFGITPTVGSGFTMLGQSNIGSGNGVDCFTEYKSTNDTSVDMDFGVALSGGIAIEIKAVPTIALTGTATASITEADIVTGGKTIILTLTNDTWVAAGATFDAQRQNIINGIDSGQAEGTGWDAVVKASQGVSGVVRTSATVVTITLDAFASYNITATETITATIPATALTEGVAIVATPTFNITHTSASSPTVTTSAATSVTGNSAVGNGNVTSDGGATITERGFVYGTSANPTTAGNKVVVAGTTGVYTGDITSLLPSTLYHYRAYAINSAGTSYGADTEFTTSAATVPTVSNVGATSITKTSVILTGNVTSIGGSAIIERGFVLSTSPTPTINDMKFPTGGSTGQFSIQITKLKSSKTYYARAFARNSNGVSYG